MALSPFPRRIILCLGDSITEQGWGMKGNRGWVAELASAYARKADIVNRGYGGFTTRTLSPIADRVFTAMDKDGLRAVLTTIFLGANDANCDTGLRGPGQPEQFVPVAEYESRLSVLTQKAKERSDVVVVIAPGPIDDRRWPTRSNAVVSTYCAAAARVAAMENVLFVDLLAATGGPFHDRSKFMTDAEAPWLDFLSDGLHLSASGNALVAEKILSVVKLHAPHASPEGLPMDFPNWAFIGTGPNDEANKALEESALKDFRQAQIAAIKM